MPGFKPDDTSQVINISSQQSAEAADVLAMLFWIIRLFDTFSRTREADMKRV